MSKQTLNVGVIGAGLIGFLHSMSLKIIAEKKALPVKAFHVADIDPEKAQKFKEIFGFEKVSEDPEKLIADPDVDVVYVCTWTNAHYEMVSAAASAKKHIFCEKPLAFNAQQASEMLNKVKQAGVNHQVGLVLRNGPIWNVVRHDIQNSDYGFPITFIFRDDQCFPIKGGHPSQWRIDPEKAGRGTLIEHSIHDLDLLEWMLGPISSIQARISTKFGYQKIEDMARVDIEFKSGMAGTLVSVWHDVLKRHSNRRLEVYHERSFHSLEAEYLGSMDRMAGEGDMKTLSIGDVNEKFWSIRGIDDPVERELSMMFGIYSDYLFLKSILQNKPASPDFGAAVRAQTLVDACYESAEKGKRIYLP